MEKKIKILLVDDHAMLRDGLKVILNAQKDMRVTGEAGTLEEAVAALDAQAAEVAVIDYSLKEDVGSDVAEALLKKDEQLKVLAISSIYSKNNIKAMIKAGATGFVLKDADVRELLEAVRATAAGKNFFSRDVSTILLDDLLKGKPVTRPQHYPCVPTDLTAREIEVLKAIVSEKTNKEIGDHLHISIKTVENHRQNLMQKIGARNTAGLVKFAIQHDLVE